ncbi:hypothetical protein HDK77DRAFT_463055 [Phyllosticta capitalensis]
MRKGQNPMRIAPDFLVGVTGSHQEGPSTFHSPAAAAAAPGRPVNSVNQRGIPPAKLVRATSDPIITCLRVPTGIHHVSLPCPSPSHQLLLLSQHRLGPSWLVKIVRSFDNRVSETIQFFTPLTLIVGYNGSGKTTIIECLKYVTTGELPSSSDRGKSFIHDPSLCGEKEVLAQVKIAFKSTSGAKMVATRSLQLTVKKSGQKFQRNLKALEGHLLMIKGGERTSISSRVAELNQILPQYLGISPAILEYVVFCHQDDSLWPMSEPAGLKKKFDEIFDALKWTKAIDNIKKLGKAQGEELGKLEIMERHFKEDKDKGARIEGLRVDVEQLATKLQAAADKSTEAYDRAATFESIVSSLAENVQNLRQDLQEMIETDAELQASLDRFEERYQRVVDGMDTNRDTVGEKQNQYHSNIDARATLIKETARRHNIRGFDFEITDEHAQQFMEKLNRMARDQQTTLDRVRRQVQDELQNAQSAISQLSERKSTLIRDKENFKSQIQTNEKILSRLESELDSIDIEDTESRLKKAREESGASQLEQKIRDTNAQLREREEQKDKLEAELVDATRRAKHKDRQRILETLTGAHGERLSNAALNEKIGELTQIKFQLTTVRDDLKKRNASLKNAEDRIAKFIGDEPIEDFPTLLENDEASVTVIQTDLSNFDAMRDYYDTCLKTLDNHSKCRMQKLEAMMKATAQKAMEEEFFEKKESLKALRELQPVYDTWLEERIETLTSTAEEQDMTLDDRLELKKDVESMSKTVQKIEQTKELEAKQNDIKQNTESERALRSSLSNLELEFRDAKSKLSTVEYQLKEKSNLLSRIQDVKNQNTGHRDSMRRTDQEIQSLSPQLEQARAKYDDDNNKLQNSVNQLSHANKAISDYIMKGGPNLIARAQAELNGLKEEGQRLDDEQRRLSSETKRAINDNIRYRHGIRQLEAADRNRYAREGQKWQDERNRLSAQQSEAMGTLKTKDDQLQQLIADWETDYKDAASKYKEAHIKYHGALDKAIINRIIEELWKKTYQGTDVDNILIRVVMVKQDAEMDMRGRCSAGQKVLASIIIRLALAECFGPTTNLDRDNIRALAESLAEIIRVRRQQRNFQLIVITHDEEFLRYMNCGDFCDYYYRSIAEVSKPIFPCYTRE